MKAVCPHCKNEFECKPAYINRAKILGVPRYCNKTCSGLARRDNKTVEQKKSEKAAYDREFREKNRERLKKEQHDRFKKTYDPVAAAIHRKSRMPYHVEYCRKPEYKKKKVKYDQQHRAKKNFGEFFESAIILERISGIIDNRLANQLKGTINKSNKRKRSWLKTKKSNLPQLP